MYSPELLSKELTYYKMKEGYLQALIEILCDHLGHDYEYDRVMIHNKNQNDTKGFCDRYKCKDCGRFGYDIKTE